MRHDRYFVAAGIGDEDRARLANAIGKDPEYTLLVDRPALLVAVERSACIVDLAGHGLIIGTLHTQGRREALNALSHDIATTITSGRGELLVRAYWGNYVAFLTDPASGRIEILRAPLGTLPCLYTDGGSSLFAASDTDLLARLGCLRRAIDWDALARFSISPDLRFGETCISGLRELRGGDRLTIGTGTASSTLWTPWSFAAPDRQFDDRTEAARRLRDAIIAATGSVAADTGRAVILLSGGLDSSVLTASAAAAGADVRCVTVSTSAAAGDERIFARKTAERTGTALAERTFALDGIDLTQSAAANLPRPVARAFEYEGRRQARLEAESTGSHALMSGGGGDNIFCSLQSVAPATDALDSPDGRAEFWRVVRELSKFTGASMFTIARRAWLRSRQRERQAPMQADWRFLDPELARRLELLRHPWLQRPPSVRQGKGAHVAGLLGVQTLTEDSDPSDPIPLRFPLLAQPVVELCLRFPTWFWYDRGCNRAVARHAFDALLPPDIAWRRSKGTPDSFVVEIYDTCRAQIREMLLEGNLAAHGLLDPGALKRTIDDPRPVSGTDHGRIMRLVDIEAWTRNVAD